MLQLKKCWGFIVDVHAKEWMHNDEDAADEDAADEDAADEDAADVEITQ